ncbi:hypothetical protein [Kibdelosporangium phytohabitans]|uniref:Uncharacterized protein n=1 Tax=Kibdelosporangium phytohabitans TaxID=860235 RepID=A0A0N9HYX8_9PSEU|nr:hypothetical protein [Kibdelosporangium phytohabitans]ALG08517.1 hypothetical protein AOZ06_17770 [Kibdelosporangium phytohabitans]MBE1470414.1 hypothetical protein [Kibdelosporangium phytohabitans]
MSSGNEGLRPGAALFPSPRNGMALRDANGNLFDLALDEDTSTAVRAALTGDGRPPAELAAFRAAGHLGQRRPWPDERARIGILAEPAIAQVLTAQFRRAGAAPVPVTAGDTADVHAVCAVHDGPAPTWWSDLDSLLNKGIGWQRVYREGRHVLFEPVADDLPHADVRARRLAAAGSGHEHLETYWTSCATKEAVLGDEHLTAAEITLVCAMAAQDLERWARGTRHRESAFVPETIPPARRLRVVDLDTFAISDHPVLPVPPCAP